MKLQQLWLPAQDLNKEQSQADHLQPKELLAVDGFWERESQFEYD